MAKLSIEDVRGGYGASEILRGVDIEVADGEVVALLGRNGMGKTSLVRAIAGMRPPALLGGKITFDGADITTLPSHRIAQAGVGLVPQGRHIFGSLTVRENLTVAARPGDWGLDQVFDFFPRLAERATARGKDLSGGEQQMLAIGRALMTNPALVLMDEPSEGLAPQVLGQIRERIELLKGDLTILLVEQNLGLALRTADRIYVLGETGRIVWQGRPAELDADPDLKRTHLGV
ncbi:MAG: ATP-binding cassette domain-containing protein [Streptosporangiales bacterium]|nr:ATP-binding cassette domain-containing protein [Streptosporangiales bacterium]